MQSLSAPLFLLIFSLWVPYAGANQVSYLLQSDHAINEFRLTACFSGFKPNYLESSMSNAYQYIINSKQMRITQQGNLKINQLDQNGCITLNINVASYITAKTSNKYFRNHANSKTKTIGTGLWMWRPMKFPTNTQFRLSVELPKQLSAAIPWKQTSHNHYQVPTSRPFMSIDSLFGEFDQQFVNIKDSKIRLAYTTPVESANQKKIRTWITKAATALSHVYGKFPREHLLILITDVNRTTSEATPFAMVSRGEGTVIQFFVNRHAPLEAFIGDWTAYHELSHLLIPFVARYNAWASEGLASYYQYLLMGRAGVLTEQATFERLLSGIERGLASYQASPKVKLKHATNNRRKYRSTRRVYWAGALAWLKADLQLRQNGSSLDLVLNQLNNCCLPAAKMWDAKTLASRLDRIVGEQVFAPIFSQTAESFDYPDYIALFAKLNIKITQGKAIFFPSELRNSLLQEPQIKAVESNPRS